MYTLFRSLYHIIFLNKILSKISLVVRKKRTTVTEFPFNLLEKMARESFMLPFFVLCARMKLS